MLLCTVFCFEFSRNSSKYPETIVPKGAHQGPQVNKSFNLVHVNDLGLNGENPRTLFEGSSFVTSV